MRFPLPPSLSMSSPHWDSSSCSQASPSNPLWHSQCHSFSSFLRCNSRCRCSYFRSPCMDNWNLRQRESFAQASFYELKGGPQVAWITPPIFWTRASVSQNLAPSFLHIGHQGWGRYIPKVTKLSYPRYMPKYLEDKLRYTSGMN